MPNYQLAALKLGTDQVPLSTRGSFEPARKPDRDLDSLIDGITVDCNDEYEQLTGFEVAFDEDANFPCSGKVVARRSKCSP